MPIPAGERPGLGAAAKLVADHGRAIVKLELALAAAELKKKVAALRLGIGLLAGAALFGLFALAFALAAGALGLGFVASGGIGATMRLLMRRGREGRQTAKVGRLRISR